MKFSGYREDKGEWHKWFAWHPVKVYDNIHHKGTYQVAWLQTVYRRCTNLQYSSCFDSGCNFIYTLERDTI